MSFYKYLSDDKKHIAKGVWGLSPSRCGGDGEKDGEGELI